jgi:hypothetical protein
VLDVRHHCITSAFPPISQHFIFVLLWFPCFCTTLHTTSILVDRHASPPGPSSKHTVGPRKLNEIERQNTTSQLFPPFNPCNFLDQPLLLSNIHYTTVVGGSMRLSSFLIGLNCVQAGRLVSSFSHFGFLEPICAVDESHQLRYWPLLVLNLFCYGGGQSHKNNVIWHFSIFVGA